ncbi:hypothetical protein R3I94_013792 [Phoxinus phoxinus]
MRAGSVFKPANPRHSHLSFTALKRVQPGTGFSGREQQSQYRSGPYPWKRARETFFPPLSLGETTVGTRYPTTNKHFTTELLGKTSLLPVQQRVE